MRRNREDADLDKTSEAYQRKKERSAARSHEQVVAYRDLPEMPPPVDPERRRQAMLSIEAFGRTYFAERFPLELSADHRQFLADVEQAIHVGGHKALGMPRGSGKTTWSEVAALWAVLSGHCRYVVLIGATGKASSELIQSIKVSLESEMLGEDFPEVCRPIHEINGTAQRCRGQTYQGKRTYIEWGRDKIVFARIPGSPCAEAVIQTAPILGRLRGMKHATSTGVISRPDLALVDDFQTDASARSPAQCEVRLKAITKGVVKLAGPNRSLAVIAPCTVIEKGDAADQILDRAKFPEFRGQRCKRVLQFPERLDLWEEYGRIRADAMRSVGNWAAATAFYEARREEMDHGAVVSWPARTPKGYVSEIEAAMAAKLTDPVAFAAEDQLEPIDVHVSSTDLQKAVIVSERFSGRPRGVAPSWATRITAGVDVSQSVLWWALAAWSDDFTGAVIDYGSWPSQHGRAYWTQEDVKHTIADALPGEAIGAQVHKAVIDCETFLASREIAREDGTRLRVDRILVDCGWQTDVLYEAHARSAYRGVTMLSRGQGYGPGEVPISDYKARPGETLYPHCLVYTPPGRSFRVARMDANAWKSHVINAIRQAPQTPGSLSFFGTSRADADHEMIADHLTAETSYVAEAKGRRVLVWEPRPGRKDNHLFDCLYAAACAACILGARDSTMQAPASTRKRTAADFQRARR